MSVSTYCVLYFVVISDICTLVHSFIETMKLRKNIYFSSNITRLSCCIRFIVYNSSFRLWHSNRKKTPQIKTKTIKFIIVNYFVCKQNRLLTLMCSLKLYVKIYVFRRLTNESVKCTHERRSEWLSLINNNYYRLGQNSILADGHGRFIFHHISCRIDVCVHVVCTEQPSAQFLCKLGCDVWWINGLGDFSKIHPEI